MLCAHHVRAVYALMMAGTALLAQKAPSPATQPAIHQAEMVERYGKPYVSVTIDGRGPYRFMIDTGTGTDAFVTPELADTLGLPVLGQTGLSDPTGQGARKAPVVLVRSLELAGMVFKDIKAVRHPVLAEAGACDGVLGFTLFRNVLLTLDFPRNLILIEEGALTADGEKSVLPFRMPEGVPIVTIRVDGLPAIDAQLDSGGGGLVLPEKFAAKLKFDVDPVVYAEGRSVSTRFQLKAARLASDVHIGRYTFPHPVVELHPAFPLANFGSPPMRNFAVTFDQRNRLVRLAAQHKRFELTAPPTPTRLAVQPAPQPSDPSLVPVG